MAVVCVSSNFLSVAESGQVGGCVYCVFCGLPMCPLRLCLSSSVILLSACCRPSRGILIGLMARTYLVPSGNWSMSVPVKVNCLSFLAVC